MKKRISFCRLAILICMLLLVSACTNSASESVQSPHDPADDAVREQSEPQEAPNAAAHSEPGDASNAEPVQETAGPQADAFSWDDMTFEGEPFLPLRTTSREELDATFGEPISVERIDAVNHVIFWEKRQYDGILITCEDRDDADFSVGTVEYQRKDLSYVKGVQVGDSLEEVLGAFLNEATEFTPEDTDAGYGVVLYGTPRHMADYGILLYEDDKPCQVMYQSQGGGIRLTLDDEGTVVSIEMFGGLYG